MKYETIELGDGLWAKRYENKTWAIFRKHDTNPILLSKEQVNRIIEVETTAKAGDTLAQAMESLENEMMAPDYVEVSDEPSAICDCDLCNKHS